ncbi:peptidoglycan binding protein, partial [Listeria seeligeri FSL S4-171]
KWNAEDNFDQATDKKGDKVSFDDVTVTGQVDTETAGTYEISYSYDGVKVVVHVTVLQNQAEITVKDSVIQVGDKWNAEDNFLHATNRDGKEIPFAHVQTSGTVNTDKAGTYQVIYMYDPNEGTEDAGKEQLSVTATIQVEAPKADPVKPTKPTNPSKPSNPSAKKDNTNLTVTNNTQHTATYQEAKPLPKTGDQTSAGIIWAGIALLGISLLLWGISARRKKQA